MTVALGCRSRPSAPGVLIITGPAPYVDPAVPRSGRATLVVAVRPNNAPELSLGYATVVLEAADGHLIGVNTGADGVARLDTVPVGKYLLRVRRIGYKPYTIPITAREACPQRAEVYLEAMPTCLFECPQAPPRATITTCAPAT